MTTNRGTAKLSFWHRVVMGLAGAALACGAFVGVMIGQDNDFEAEDQWEEQVDRETFYLMVKGDVEPNSILVGEFVEDLQERLAQPNPQQAVADFRGNSNLYGGIEDNLGFDLFDERGLQCEECGPLRQDVQKILVSGTVPRAGAEPSADYTTTPFGWSWPLTALFYVVVVGNLSLIIVHSVMKLDINYRDVRLRDLPWDDTKDSDIKSMVILAPLVALPAKYRHEAQERGEDAELRKAFPSHMNLIDAIDKALAKAHKSRKSSEAVWQLTVARERLYAEMVRQCDEGETEGDEDALAELGEQVKESLAFFDARTSAKNELRQRTAG